MKLSRQMVKEAKKDNSGRVYRVYCDVSSGQDITHEWDSSANQLAESLTVTMSHCRCVSLSLLIDNSRLLGCV